MATMNVFLPDPMMDWVDAQARSERYDTASDYLHHLIRRDQERVDKIAAMQGLVTQGVESGVSDRSMEEVLDAARRQARLRR